MKKLIFFVFVCGMISSCGNNNKYDLPQDKIPLLKNNDIVYFQDSVSYKVDTFSLKIDDYFKYNHDWDSYRVISIFYNKVGCSALFSYNAIAYPKVGEIFEVFYYINMPINYEKTTNITSYSIRGIIYPSVYISQGVTPDSIPNKIYFTIHNGVIRYEYKDGRVFNLLSK